MKRRSYEPHTQAPSQIQFLSRQDMSRGKRAKLVDIGVDNSPLNSKFDTSSRPVEATKAARSGDAKTSEFAFFKKLKEDAGKKFASHMVESEPNRCDNFGLRSISKHTENKHFVSDDGYKDVRTSLLVENATPVNFISYNSPLGGAGEKRKSDVHKKKACATLEDVQWKQKDREDYSHSLRPEGTQHRHAEVFSRKRQKLHRWVTDISFPEIDGLCSKGYDVVSVLLSRLIPESKANNVSSLIDGHLNEHVFLFAVLFTEQKHLLLQNAKDQKFGQVDTEAKSALAAYHESDIYCKNHQWIPTRGFTDIEFEPYLDETTPHSWSNRARGRICCLEAPYSHDNSTEDWYRVWEPDSQLLGGNMALCIERDLIFSVPFRRFRFIEPVEELDHLTLPNKHLVGNQSNTPMLGWDYDKKEVESLTFHEIDPNAHPTSLVPWIDSDKHNASKLFSLSSIHGDEEFGIHLSSISSYHNQEYGVHVLEDREDVLLDSDHIPLIGST